MIPMGTSIPGKPIPMTTEEAATYVRDDRAFRKSNQMMCENSDELVKQYPDQWVGLHYSLGVLHSDTRIGLRQQMRKHGFPDAQTVVSLMESNPRMLIL